MAREDKRETRDRIASVFGWIWIIASIAALALCIMAIGFGGEWSSFFLALGVSLVAKVLARIFERKRIRAASG